jgi:hypothetical protein
MRKYRMTFFIAAVAALLLGALPALAAECRSSERLVTTVHVMGSGEMGGHQFCAPAKSVDTRKLKLAAPHERNVGSRCQGEQLLVHDGRSETCVEPKSLRAPD